MYLKTPARALYSFNILAFMSQENENKDLLQDNELTAEEQVEQLQAKLEEERQAREKAEQAIIKSKQKAKKEAKSDDEDETKVTDKHSHQVDMLRLNGTSLEEIEQLKKIASIDETDLIEARNSELFKLWKTTQENEEKNKQASVGTSKRGRVVTRTSDDIKRSIMDGNYTKEDISRIIKEKYGKE